MFLDLTRLFSREFVPFIDCPFIVKPPGLHTSVLAIRSECQPEEQCRTPPKKGDASYYDVLDSSSGGYGVLGSSSSSSRVDVRSSMYAMARHSSGGSR